MQRFLAKLFDGIRAILKRNLHVDNFSNDKLVELLRRIDTGRPHNRVSVGGDVAGYGKRFSLEEGVESAFAKAVDAVAEGKAVKGYVRLGNTPDALKAIGLPNVKVTIHGSTLKKVMGGKHNLTKEALKQLPAQLNNPVAVMNSSFASTKQDGYVVLTELVERENGKDKPVIAALHLKQDANGIQLLNVASVYGRRLNQLQSGLDNELLYWNKGKGLKFVKAFGLRLPAYASTDSALAENNIKTDADLAQAGRLRFSRSSDGLKSAYEKAKADGKTELTFNQWKQVRTPEFKAWFGDWENDPENASKVVHPETGEPLVVYHGTENEFTVFEKYHEGYDDSPSEAFFFTDNKDAAEEYSGSGGVVVTAFLNVRDIFSFNNRSDLDKLNDAIDDGDVSSPFYGLTPERFDFGENVWDKIADTQDRLAHNDVLNGILNYLEEDGYDGVLMSDSMRDVAEYNSYAVFNPNQIKSATDNTGEFDSANDDIRFSRSAMKSVDANISRGRKAMNHVIRNKADAKRAMYRNDIGRIDFVWVDKGKTLANGKTRRAMGIAHILDKRMSVDGLSFGEAVKMLTERVVETIAKGGVLRRVDGGKSTRVEISYNGNTAQLVKRSGSNGWLLTAYDNQTVEQARGATRQALHNHAPTRSRGELGASDTETNIAQPEAAGQSEQGVKFRRSADVRRNVYDKAKEAGKTKLTFNQWKQVRTPEFKAWFGDWENGAVESRLLDGNGEPKVFYPKRIPDTVTIAREVTRIEERKKKVREKVTSYEKRNAEGNVTGQSSTPKEGYTPVTRTVTRTVTEPVERKELVAEKLRFKNHENNVFSVKTEDNKTVGYLSLWKEREGEEPFLSERPASKQDGGEYFVPHKAELNAEYRNMGIGELLYRFAEQELNAPIYPARSQTEAAKGLWRKRHSKGGYGGFFRNGKGQVKSATDNIGTFDAANTDVRFSRKAATRAKYEQRIDELFAGAKAERFGGATVLDRADVLDMLGYGNMPLRLAEGKVIAGKTNHPLMTAAVWKKVPDWIENPAMVFESDTVLGRLVLIAPEKVKGQDVRIVIKPNGDNLHVLVNLYDVKSGVTPYVRWAQDGLLRYVDKTKAARISERFRLRLPDILKNPSLAPNAQIHGMGRGNAKDLRRGKILTEKNLQGYRKNNPLAAEPLKFARSSKKMTKAEALAHNLSGAVNAVANLDRNVFAKAKDAADGKRIDLMGIGLQALGRRQIVDIYGDMIPELLNYDTLSDRFAADGNIAAVRADRPSEKKPAVRQCADRRAVTPLC